MSGGETPQAPPDDAAVLDRVEDGVAVLLVGPEEVEVTLPAGLLPAGAREGDWFRFLVPDADLTVARGDRIAARLDEIRRTRRGGRFGT